MIAPHIVATLVYGVAVLAALLIIPAKWNLRI